MMGLAAAGIWLVINILLWIVCIVAIAAIFLFAWYRLFKLCGHPNPWAAFIPFYNWWVMCDCCDADYVDLIGPIHFSMTFLRWCWIPCIIIPFIFPSLALVEVVFLFLALGWMYMMMFANAKGTTPQEEMFMGYLCATNPILALIIMYKIEPVGDN